MHRRAVVDKQVYDVHTEIVTFNPDLYQDSWHTKT